MSKFILEQHVFLHIFIFVLYDNDSIPDVSQKFILCLQFPLQHNSFMFS